MHHNSVIEKKIVSKYKDDHVFCSFCKKLIEIGATPYLVGGFVRDTILGIVPKDYDIIIDKNVNDEQLKNIANNYGSVIIKPIFGIRIKCTGKDIDLWRFSDYHFINSSLIYTIKQALDYFDFNINALAFNIKDEQFIDPYKISINLNSVQVNILDNVQKFYSFEDKSIIALKAIKVFYKTNLKLSEETLLFIGKYAKYSPKLTWEIRDSIGSYLYDQNFIKVLKKIVGNDLAEKIIMIGKNNCLTSCKTLKTGA